MKKLLYLIGDKKILFKLNFIEYFFFMRVFKNKRYEAGDIDIRGQEYHGVVCDEWVTLKPNIIKFLKKKRIEGGGC